MVKRKYYVIGKAGKGYKTVQYSAAPRTKAGAIFKCAYTRV